MANDILQDVFGRLSTVLGHHQASEALRKIEREVRRDWGGERCYIGKRPEDYAEQLASRDNAVRRHYSKGESAECVARRYGISVKRVQQIVALEAAIRTKG